VELWAIRIENRGQEAAPVFQAQPHDARDDYDLFRREAGILLADKSHRHLSESTRGPKYAGKRV
jgi:hypothetical protein